MSDSMDLFQKRVGEWGERTFPDATIATIHAHLFEEAQELKNAVGDWLTNQKRVDSSVIWPSVMEEVADVILLAFHLAYRKGFSLREVVEGKFLEVETAQWEMSPEGYLKRVKPEPTEEEQGE